MGLFKTYQYKGVPLTNSNTKFVSPTSGSDSNPGTREAPYATVTKVYQNTLSYTLLNGLTTENLQISANNNVLINDSNAIVQGNSTDLQYAYSSYGIQFNGNVVKSSWNPAYIYNAIIKGYLSGFCRGDGNFIDEYRGYQTSDFKNNTIYKFVNYSSSTPNSNIINNSIIVESVDLYNFTSLTNTTYIPIFKHCLFRKATVWKWNGAIIPINWGAYGNTEGDYLSDVISALYIYASAMVVGAGKTYLLGMIPSANSSNIFYTGTNGQTCKIVEDRPSVLGSIKVFNRYVNDSPVDYSLYLSADNFALTMSDQLGYIGCYKANAKVLTFGAVMHVNVDGSDDLVTVPDMLISDGNGKFHVSTADSVQIRNRVRSDVFNFKRGFNLTAFQSQIKSGLGSRFSMGKFQPYNITNSPTLPQESIEILPYDDENTPSVFPRFSGMFNGQCQMWYHTTGAKINQPVLFNDLQSFFAITTDKSLAEYGTWAVTNADFETYLLSSKTGVALRNIPVYYGKIELNLNYHI